MTNFNLPSVSLAYTGGRTILIFWNHIMDPSGGHPSHPQYWFQSGMKCGYEQDSVWHYWYFACLPDQNAWLATAEALYCMVTLLKKCFVSVFITISQPSCPHLSSLPASSLLPLSGFLLYNCIGHEVSNVVLWISCALLQHYVWCTCLLNGLKPIINCHPMSIDSFYN